MQKKYRFIILVNTFFGFFRVTYLIYNYYDIGIGVKIEMYVAAFIKDLIARISEKCHIANNSLAECLN